MFRSRDTGQNNKRSLTFCTGVKFSSWSNFNETGLKWIKLSCRFRKCIVLYTKMSRFWSKGGQSSTATDHRGPIGSLTFDPLDSHTSRLPRYAKLYFLWIISVIQLIWAQFHWNRTSLKIWPLYKRSMTFSYFDLYLKKETLYEFRVIDFFAPYDPRKNLTCITTLSKHVDYFSAM